MKKIDLKKTLFELTEEYPELIEILFDIGFLGVRDPTMRITHGKMTTIPQGCKMQGINLEDVVNKLRNKGFEV